MPRLTAAQRVAKIAAAIDPKNQPNRMKALTKTQKVQVKRMIGKQIETKFVTRLLENNTTHNSQISAPDMLPIVPTVNQGTDDYQRVGDTIRPTRLNIRGLISMDRTNVSSNQVLLVRVLVLEPRNAKTYAVSVPQYATYANSLLKMNLDTGTATQPL